MKTEPKKEEKSRRKSRRKKRKWKKKPKKEEKVEEEAKKEDMKKEKAMAASVNMITTLFIDAKTKGHTRRLIAEHGYIKFH